MTFIKATQGIDTLYGIQGPLIHVTIASPLCFRPKDDIVLLQSNHISLSLFDTIDAFFNMVLLSSIIHQKRSC